MKSIKRILNDDRGASLVFALIGFLICAFVSITIVNAAVLNAQRTQSEIDEQKAYMATTAAADAIRKEIWGDLSDATAGATGVVEYKKIKDGTSYVVEKDDPINGRFSTIFDEAINQAEGSSSTQQHTISFSVSGIDGIQTVEGQLKMDESYSMVIELNAVVADGSKIGNYPLRVHIPAVSISAEDLDKENLQDGDILKAISWKYEDMFVTGVVNKKQAN